MKKENVVVKTLNCRGLYCPLPITGYNKTGNRLLEASEENCVFTYAVEKV